jgi:hypothetical protein
MRCATLEDLLANYQRAVHDYRIATVALIEKHGAEFDRRAKEANRLHRLAREAFEKMDRHERQHGCGKHLTFGTLAD